MRMTCCWVLGALVGVLLAGAVQASEGNFSERLSEADFRRAGLHKLSAAERAALDDLVAGRVRVETEQAATAAVERERARERTRLFRGPATRDEAIESRLQGEFRGWGPRTTFRLENGEWWRVDEDTSYVTRPVDSPVVRIERGAMGSYWMRIGERGPRVKVRPME